MIVYKLTDEKLQSHGSFQWEIGKTCGPLSGKGDLCGSGWFHVYTSAELAAFLNLIHASFDDPLFFEAEASGQTKTDHGLKLGVTSLRLLRQIPAIKPTAKQRIAFGIYCSWQVYRDSKWQQWACDWLNGGDRGSAAAHAAAYAADAANVAYAAVAAAAHAAASAAACTKGALDLDKLARQALTFEG